MTSVNSDSFSPEELDNRALRRLKENRRTGYDPYYKIEYEYSIPSKGRYHWQWFWDSCFHVIALARLDPAMARRELDTLLATQREDGFIGHITYWGRRGAFLSALYAQSSVGQWRRRQSAMIQPPVLAHAVEAVFNAVKDEDALKADLDKAESFYKWISRERDPDETGLFRIISPYECGLDNSPVFDGPLGLKNPGRKALLWKNRKLDVMNLVRGNYDYKRLRAKGMFSVVDPLMNAIFADGVRTLERLAIGIGDTQRAGELGRIAEKTEQAIENELWDETSGSYIYLSDFGERRLTTLTAGSIMPLITGSIPKERLTRIVDEHLLNDSEFWTPLPIPSSPRSEPTYDPVGVSSIWRGPVCMNLNWLIVRGLRSHGHTDLAADIAGKSQRAAFVDFREFYSPEDGKGMRGTDFGWATIVVDM